MIIKSSVISERMDNMVTGSHRPACRYHRSSGLQYFERGDGEWVPCTRCSQILSKKFALFWPGYFKFWDLCQPCFQRQLESLGPVMFHLNFLPSSAYSYSTRAIDLRSLALLCLVGRRWWVISRNLTVPGHLPFNRITERISHRTSSTQQLKRYSTLRTCIVSEKRLHTHASSIAVKNIESLCSIVCSY